MTLNGGRLETMALVSVALHCPPPPEPLSSIASAPRKHNSESGGGVGGWVGTGWTLPTAETWSVCHVECCFGSSRTSMKWFKYCFRFDLVESKETFLKMPQRLPSFSYPSGSASMRGIYQGLPRWVQACLCSSGMALYYLRNVEQRCLACPWWARETDSVC